MVPPRDYTWYIESPPDRGLSAPVEGEYLVVMTTSLTVVYITSIHYSTL